MPDRRRVWLLGLSLLLWQGTALAQDVDDVKENLAEKMKALDSAAKEQEKLAEQEVELREELSDLQGDLVGIAAKIQSQEKTLSELEANLVNLQDEERAKTDSLIRRKRELSVLVQSMLKLSHIPPEMVVAMPGNFEDTLRTAKVLGLTSNALLDEAKAISEELVEIKALQVRIRDSHAQISTQKSRLETQQAKLSGKLDTRSTIQDRLLTRREAQEQAVARLSKESNTLRELMSQLEERRQQEAEKAAKLAVVPEFKPDAPKPKATKPAKEPTRFASAKGKVALPAEGNIFLRYGEQNPDGDKSQGIHIRTRETAQVTSPYAGEVVYTGTFLDYGNMIIIRHENDYHSLLAGMETVTASLGQQLIEGEPVGEMGRTEDKTALYMEIRERNRPVDPIPWLESHRVASR